jgi:hypothetical protein
MRKDGRTYGQTDGQTDMKKVTVAFRHYAKAPKKKFLGQMSKHYLLTESFVVWSHSISYDWCVALYFWEWSLSLRDFLHHWFHGQHNKILEELPDFVTLHDNKGDRCSTVVKVLCYKSIPAAVIGIFHWHKILPIALWPWGRLSL